jgi:hypothetical protein
VTTLNKTVGVGPLTDPHHNPKERVSSLMSHNQDNRLGVRPLLALTAFGAILGGALYYSAPAKADPVSDYTSLNANTICAVIDTHPNAAGVAAVVLAVVRDGFTARQAGTIVGTAVIGYCPENMPAIKQFIAAYAPSTSTSAPDTRTGWVA